jgi:NTP pyrophosphatase (non-canonical NTP hydrolase)
VGPALRELQEFADQVYGRLEPERAVAWTLEELGELAQAMRRSSSSPHLEEELGQLFAWVLCLANINGVDLGSAITDSIDDEVERQVAKYGELRPYGGGRRAATAGVAEGRAPPR